MMSMKSHTRFPVGKLTILLPTGCLLLFSAGCGGHGKSATSAPVPTTVPTQTQRLRPPATSSQQPTKQTAADNQGIVFIHSHSPGHSYRITLPGYWRGKYSVKETNGQRVEDGVTFYFYKPIYVIARAGSNQKAALGGEDLFSIETETESQCTSRFCRRG